MAYILKEGKVYLTNQGFDGTEYYAVIDRVELNKKEVSCNFSLDIYKNKSARTNSLQICGRFNFFIEGQDAINIGLASNIFKAAYNYAGIKLDNSGELVLKDWMSDEA